MKLLKKVGSLILTACFSFVGSALHAQTDSSLALEFLKKWKLNANLYLLTSDAMMNTTTFRIMVNNQGLADSRNLLVKNMVQILPKYQTEWDRNMAAVYAQHFSAEELQSLTQEGPKSPWAKKLASPTTQEVLGQEMREKSSSILQAAAAEVLSKSFEQMPVKKSSD